MLKKVSLKDIAQKLGVSTALVSYVLNDQKQGRISKETVARIKQTAEELQYRPNQIAKSLKTNKTYTLGLVVADIANPFFSTLARYIEDAAARQQYTVLFGSSDENAEKSSKLIQTLVNRQVDGLIIAAAEGTEDQVRELQQREVPFVLVDRYFPKIPTNYVAIDNYKAAFQATKHLLEAGQRKIALITYKSELFHLQERKRGYIEAVKDFRIKPAKELIKEVPLKSWRESVHGAIDELRSMPEPPDALLFTNNLLSVAGLKHLNRLSAKVPEDIAIVSFDESEAAELFHTPLTYLKQPLKEIAETATQIILESIARNNKMVQVNMEAELIIRASSMRTASVL